MRDCEDSAELGMGERREMLDGDPMGVRHVGQDYYCCQTKGPNVSQIILDPSGAQRQSVVKVQDCLSIAFVLVEVTQNAEGRNEEHLNNSSSCSKERM